MRTANQLLPRVAVVPWTLLVFILAGTVLAITGVFVKNDWCVYFGLLMNLGVVHRGVVEENLYG